LTSRPGSKTDGDDRPADQATAPLDVDRLTTTLPLPHFRQRKGFDELSNGGAGFNPESNKLPFRKKAAVLTGQALHQNDKTRAIHHIARWLF
jgi:hypothetical protein